MAIPALREQLASDDGPEWVSPGLPLYLRHRAEHHVVQEDLRGLFFERAHDGAERPRRIPWGKRLRQEAKEHADDLGVSPTAVLLAFIHAWARLLDVPSGADLSLSIKLQAQLCGVDRSTIHRALTALDCTRSLRYARGGFTGTVAADLEPHTRRWLRRDRQLVRVSALNAQRPEREHQKTWLDANGKLHTHADIRGVGRAHMALVHALGIRVRTVTGCYGVTPVRQEVSCSSPIWEDLCKSLESAKKTIELRLLVFRKRNATPYKYSSLRFLDSPPNLSSKGGVRGDNFIPSGSDPPAQGEGVPVGDAIGWPLGSHEPFPRDTGVAAVGPIGGGAALPPGRKNASRANHGNPRALGTNPRASWDNPRGRVRRAASMQQFEGFAKAEVLGVCVDCGAPAETSDFGTLYCYAHINSPF